MAISEDKIRAYTRRLLQSRMRLLCSHGFFGLLLMHMRYAVDEAVATACTDGELITFGTDFLAELNDTELDFVMMHEVMHAALLHCVRGKDCDQQLFNIACDIVVNSNILHENGMRPESITLRIEGEPAMHLAPNGKEGHLYTAEEVYAMLLKKQSGSGKSGGDGQSQEKNGNANGSASSQGNKNGDRTQPGGDSDGARTKGKRLGSKSAGADNVGTTWDDHSRWGTAKTPAEILDGLWTQHTRDAAEAMSIREAATGCGSLPLLAKRILDSLKKSQTDWRTVLHDFVQEDVVDYSFSPPDRRFADSPFFLPDFNEKDESIKNVLFMIDTSGSMSDAMITAAYSEVVGAIEQFGGKLSGLLGFFDHAMTEPEPFTDKDELLLIRPVGGGGTSFEPIFRYATTEMEEPPSSIIILTDGFAPFPDKSATADIPVLWIINNEEVDPPWGKVVRLSQNENN